MNSHPQRHIKNIGEVNVYRGHTKFGQHESLATCLIELLQRVRCHDILMCVYTCLHNP